MPDLFAAAAESHLSEPYVPYSVYAAIIQNQECVLRRMKSEDAVICPDVHGDRLPPSARWRRWKSGVLA